MSIDESMIGTKARLSFLQYLPMKPTKWGVKVWVCAEAETGYIYNFDVYTGKSGKKSEHGLAYDVVMGLMEDLLESGRVLYTDNFYSSLILFEELYSRGIYASGTCRTNKKQFPSTELETSSLTSGGSKFFYHGSLTAGKWVDKRKVHFLSTLFQDQVETIECRGAGGVREEIDKPKIVINYNQYMSGVDIADQLMVLMLVAAKV